MPHRSIIIADDSPTTRKLVARDLDGLGPQLREAADAVQVIELMSQTPGVALLILDYEMPGLNALQLLGALRKPGLAERLKSMGNDKTPIVMLVGSDRRSDRLALFELGIVDFFLKPFARGQLRARAQAILDPQAAQPAERTLAILLAEDNLVNSKLISKILAGWGHHVSLARHGAEAVALFTAARDGTGFDMVLTDIEMPELDGYGVTREIRALEQRAGAPPTPIIAMTAHKTEEEQHKCLAIGMNDVVTKPVRKDALRWCLACYAPPVEP